MIELFCWGYVLVLFNFTSYRFHLALNNLTSGVRQQLGAVREKSTRFQMVPAAKSSFGRKHKVEKK